MTGSLLPGATGVVAALVSIGANGTGAGVGRGPGLLDEVESVLVLFKLRPSLLLRLSLRLSMLGFENTVVSFTYGEIET
jgi:hypothetical protein